MIPFRLQSARIRDSADGDVESLLLAAAANAFSWGKTIRGVVAALFT